MLYDKSIRRVCALCQHSCDFRADEVLCRKKGPVAFDGYCRRFRYDPLRRKPMPQVPMRMPVEADAFKL